MFHTFRVCRKAFKKIYEYILNGPLKLSEFGAYWNPDDLSFCKSNNIALYNFGGHLNFEVI